MNGTAQSTSEGSCRCTLLSDIPVAVCLSARHSRCGTKRLPCTRQGLGCRTSRLVSRPHHLCITATRCGSFTHRHMWKRQQDAKHSAVLSKSWTKIVGD